MKTKALVGNKLLFSGLITGGILILVYIFSSVYPFSSVLHYSNLGIRNILFSVELPWEETKIHKDLTLVTIDDKTLTDKDVGGLGRWQEFKREYYAQVIENLNKAGATVIGVDVLFSEKAEGDEVLAATIKKAGNVVLGASISKSQGEEQVLPPTKVLIESAHDIGYFQPLLDPANDLVYGISPNIRLKDGTLYEPFSLSTLRKYLDVNYGTSTKVSEEADRYIGFAKFHEKAYEFIPLSREDRNEVLINYVPRDARFTTLSFVDVYNDKFNHDSVKNKMVFLGATATALHDEFFTPVGIISGVGVHMNFINTILNGDYLSYISPVSEYIIIVLLTLFLTLFLMHVENRVYQLIYSFVALTIGVFFYLLVFGIAAKIFTHPTEIVMIVILVAISVTAYKYIFEEKGKRLLKNTLSQYLAEDLVTSILSNYEEVKLGGTKKEVTLFFSDIAGFTTLSERMEPEELVRFLSVYLKEVSDIIIHERGFVNKYEGDAVMAIWGAFVLENRQSYLACKSAILQQEAIGRMNTVFKKEFGFEIEVRMGLNKGLAVVGNIGSSGKKIEYTALGDTVNTASRFEGINKMYGTLICAGESIAKDEREHFVFRKLDSIMVKGKDLPVLIFELVGRKDEVDMAKLECISQFEEAFKLYQNRQFESALKMFETLAIVHKDPPSLVFAERAKEYIEKGCPADWVGHYRATEK